MFHTAALNKTKTIGFSEKCLQKLLAHMFGAACKLFNTSQPAKPSGTHVDKVFVVAHLFLPTLPLVSKD